MKQKQKLVSPFVEIEIVGLDCDNSKFKTIPIRKYTSLSISIVCAAVWNQKFKNCLYLLWWLGCNSHVSSLKRTLTYLLFIYQTFIFSAVNGLNPVWSKQVTDFDIVCPDVALIRFVVCDEDVFGDPNVLGQATYPVKCLRSGNTLNALKSVKLTPLMGINLKLSLLNVLLWSLFVKA